MSVLLEVTFQDVNQEVSKSSMWVESEEVSADVLVALKAASNAKIIKATLSTPVDISGISSNTALANNVETVTSRAIISMRGIDVDSTGEPFARVKIGIPAPQGTIINSLAGDPSFATAQNLMNDVLSKSGVQMTTIDSIKYSR